MSPHSLIDDNLAVLASGAAILSTINDHQFVHIPTPYFSASLGKHFRHILDHYFSFFSGIGDGPAQGHIDYDRRDRDTGIETDRRAAHAAVNKITSELRQLQLVLGNREQEATAATLAVSLQTGVMSPTRPVASSLERELIFLHGHTTHHYAIIAAMLKIQGCAIDESFGVAPSTLSYENQLKCAQ